MVVALACILLILFLFLGVPVAFSLAISGSIGLWLTDGLSTLLSIISTSPYRTAASFILTTVPMFILMSEFASIGRLTEDLFTMVYRWIGHLPGGVAITTVIASAGFGAMCGTSTGAAAGMARIATPEMLKYGYRKDMATGVVVVGGTLAIMIPPSVPLVIYGITTEVSIGKLLIAGIIPGLLTALIYCLGIFFWVKVDPGVMRPVSPFSWKERWVSLKAILPLIIIILIIIGGMYSGFASPSEVASVGALGVFLVCLVMRRFGWKGFLLALERTVKTTAMIFTIMIGAMVMGYFFTVTNATQNLINWLGNTGLPSWGIFIGVVLLYLVLGCFMDQLPILLLTLPLTFPLVMSLGYDPIWFGIIVTALCEIGLVTPPVGMASYVVNAVTGIPLETVFKGAGTMLIFEFVTLILLLIFPVIATWLPSLMR